MKILLILIPIIILLILLGTYFYKYILKIAKFWNVNTNKKKNRIILALSILVVFAIATYISKSFVVIFLHWIFIAMLLSVINILCSKIAHKKNKEFKVWNKIYGSGLIPVVLTIIILIYGYYNMFNVVETDYSVDINKQVKDGGYKIAFISDLHYGLTFGQKELSKYCNNISKKNVDVVILGGDIVDENTTKAQMQEAFLELGKIKSNYGVFYVYGNHDASRYSNKPKFNKDDIAKEVSNNNIKILEDSSYAINDEFIVLGRIDASYDKEVKRKNGQELLQGLNKEAFLLLIDHQPRDYKENSKCGYDLEVSGHTHGGQFFPVKFFCELFNINDMMYGKRKIGNFNAIVSSGIAGWGFPFKTQTKAEYLIITVI